MTASIARQTSFHVFSPSLLKDIRQKKKFILLVSSYFISFGRKWGCELTVSERRLEDAYNAWVSESARAIRAERAARLRDVDSTDKDDPRRNEPLLDHLKHAAILCFWLRRNVLINEVWPIDAAGNRLIPGKDDLTGPQRHFLQYGSELAALCFGFHIALNYELQIKQAERTATGKKFPEIADLIRDTVLPGRFAYDYPRYLKTANISWQAIYMGYAALFDGWGE